MALDLFTDKLPEEIRETFKAEIAKYALVDSRESAKAILTNNPHFNAEFQSALSTKYEESMKKFQAEKMPVMIEEEIKKRGTKQPWEIEIDALKAENALAKREALLKDRKAQAVSELAKLGLDPELADFVLDEDEGNFKAKVERLTGKVTSWRDEAVKKAKTEVFGQTTPQGGQSQTASFTRETLKTTEGRKAFLEAQSKGVNVSITE